MNVSRDVDLSGEHTHDVWEPKMHVFETPDGRRRDVLRQHVRQAMAAHLLQLAFTYNSKKREDASRKPITDRWARGVARRGQP